MQAWSHFKKEIIANCIFMAFLKIEILFDFLCFPVFIYFIWCLNAEMNHNKNHVKWQCSFWHPASQLNK